MAAQAPAGAAQAAPPTANLRREPDGTVIAGPEGYTMVRRLGAGSYGTTFLEREPKTGELVAVKYLRREEVTPEVRREILNHRRLTHPNIILFKRLHLTATHVAIVMEHAAGGELYKFVSALWARGAQLSENKARFLFQQLISGVAYLHSQAVVHRDLKLENTLLMQGPVPQLKICDFGFSKAQDSNSETSTMVGTASYMAPELVPIQLGGSYTGAAYDGRKVDCWACGVFLYAMLFSDYPFGSDADENLPHRIVAAKYQIPTSTFISEDCKDLMHRIFVPDPHQRISIEDIMNHTWFLRNLPPDLQPSVQAQKSAEHAARIQSAAEIEGLLDQA